MNIYDTLVGKKMLIETDMLVSVELVIDRIQTIPHSVDLEPATPQNDWWPASRNWSTFRVWFTNGAFKDFDSIEKINFY